MTKIENGDISRYQKLIKSIKI